MIQHELSGSTLTSLPFRNSLRPAGSSQIAATFPVRASEGAPLAPRLQEAGSGAAGAVARRRRRRCFRRLAGLPRDLACKAGQRAAGCCPLAQRASGLTDCTVAGASRRVGCSPAGACTGTSTTHPYVSHRLEPWMSKGMWMRVPRSTPEQRLGCVHFGRVGSGDGEYALDCC